MINLKKHRLSKGNPSKHTWRALEEILAFSVVRDASIAKEDKKKYLLKVLNDAKLACIVDGSVGRKISNINTMINGGSYNHNNIYAVDVYHNSTDLSLLKIYNDIYINFWRKDTLKTANPNIFENHDIKLLISKFISICFKRVPPYFLPLSYFTKKIEEYKKAIFKHVTPQHYIEHINAIGHLDKIVILSSGKKKIIENALDSNIIGDITDFMGMFVPCTNGDTAKLLTDITNEKVKEKETVIMLCPENMIGMISKLKKNQPTIMDMMDKVFSHEIGHLAFYFYYSKLRDCECWRTIAEKQANWISSISHNGKIDDLIEEVSSLQPPKYHYPVLLKHIADRDYYQLVEGLYLR